MRTLGLHNKRFRGQHRNFVSSTTVSMMLAGGGVMGNTRAMYAMTCFLTSFYDASAAGLRSVYVAGIIVSDPRTNTTTSEGTKFNKRFP